MPIPHEIYIKQILPIPYNIPVSTAKDVDMGKSEYIPLSQRNDGGIEAIYSTGFGGCTGFISLENDEYSSAKIRETHFDPIQLSNDEEVKQRLTCIPNGSPIIIFAPFSYIKTAGKYEKIIHPNLTKIIDEYIKYRTDDYQIIEYPATEDHSFGCTYDSKTREANVYTSTLPQPVYTYTFK